MIKVGRVPRPLMRPVFVLCRLGRREMAWVGRELRRVWYWIWGLFGRFWRGLTWLCLSFLEVTGRPRLRDRDRDREERGSRDPESSGAESMPKETVREPLGEAEEEGEDGGGGRGEAPERKRALASPGGTQSKRPRDEEEEEECGVDTSDEFYCEYDSTWEEEHEENPPRRLRRKRNYTSGNFRNFERAAKDMQNFRHWYLYQSRLKTPRRKLRMRNLEFYLGQAASEPDGCYISDFHSEWFEDYDKLEQVHSFIQWLFPLQEPGVNYLAPTLTPEEAEEFRKSDEAKKNLLKSYKLMLDFYGIKMSCDKTGRVQRSDNWSERFDNLNRHTHNNLRITRILKCLGILGFQKYQYHLVHFFLEETLVNKELPRVKESALSYFVFAVLDRRERRQLLEFAFSKFSRQAEFVWCPKKIQDKWLKKETNDEGGACDATVSSESSNINEYLTDDRSSSSECDQ